MPGLRRRVFATGPLAACPCSSSGHRRAPSRPARTADRRRPARPGCAAGRRGPPPPAARAASTRPRPPPASARSAPPPAGKPRWRSAAAARACRRAGRRFRQLGLNALVLYLGEGGDRVRAVTVSKPVERRRSALCERQRHRRLQIGVDLRRGEWDAEEGGERLRPRRCVGIVARDIHIGVSPAFIPLRVGVRLVGVLQPEQPTFGQLYEVIALEAILRRHAPCLQRPRRGDRSAVEVADLLRPRRLQSCIRPSKS